MTKEVKFTPEQVDEMKTVRRLSVRVDMVNTAPVKDLLDLLKVFLDDPRIPHEVRTECHDEFERIMYRHGSQELREGDNE